MEGRLKKLNKKELKELYDKDFPLWAEINLKLLKEKAYELVDWEHLLEEIEDMARSELKACISYLAVILEHLYKWDNFRHLSWAGGEGWIRSVERARNELLFLLDTYPSLRAKLPQNTQDAWREAVKRLKNWLIDLEEEEKLDFGQRKRLENQIPKESPYTYETAITRDLRQEMD